MTWFSIFILHYWIVTACKGYSNNKKFLRAWILALLSQARPSRTMEARLTNPVRFFPVRDRIFFWNAHILPITPRFNSFGLKVLLQPSLWPWEFNSPYFSQQSFSSWCHNCSWKKSIHPFPCFCRFIPIPGEIAIPAKSLHQFRLLFAGSETNPYGDGAPSSIMWYWQP